MSEGRVSCNAELHSAAPLLYRRFSICRDTADYKSALRPGCWRLRLDRKLLLPLIGIISTVMATAKKSEKAGKLRIGDNWNAIRIIALSQSNPLKAVAEFVENSIDARAKRITLVRGKEHGIHFLRVKDDGEGIRLNEAGRPDFEFVATHICDSIKRRLKADGVSGLQGEFGIGLLSFWTV